MKQFMILGVAALAFLYVNMAEAQDFKAPLQKTMAAFDTTQDMQAKVDLSNKLSLVAKKWNDAWQPHYYAAYSKTVLSYDEKKDEKRDAYLDEAEKELGDAVQILGKDNDETYVLAAMIANARLAVNPMNRWQKYGKIFDENLTKAKEINPNNPRIYFLQGISKYHTPKAFGGGKKNALPYLEKADGLFAKETTDDISKPTWGKRTNTYFLNESRSDKE